MPPMPFTPAAAAAYAFHAREPLTPLIFYERAAFSFIFRLQRRVSPLMAHFVRFLIYLSRLLCRRQPRGFRQFTLFRCCFSSPMLISALTPDAAVDRCRHSLLLLSPRQRPPPATISPLAAAAFLRRCSIFISRFRCCFADGASAQLPPSAGAERFAISAG